MPTVEESVRERLGTDVAVAGLVEDRIYPTQIPDYEIPSPWVMYAVRESEPSDTLAGETTLIRYRFEFDVLADTYAAGRDVAEAIRLALHDWSGGQVAAAFWVGTNSNLVDDGYHFEVAFNVWGYESGIVPSAAGLPRVIVQADGLYFGGVRVGSSLDAGALTGNTLAGTVTHSSLQSIGTLTPSAVVSTPLIVQALAGQTANLAEWRTSAGVVVTCIRSDGTISVPSRVPSATTNPLVIRSAVSGSYIEPVWYMGVPGAEANGLAWRSNGYLQFSNGLFLNADSGLSLGTPSAPYGMKRGNGQAFHLDQYGGDGIWAFTTTSINPTEQVVSMTTTSALRRVYTIDHSWTDSTDATRKSRVKLSVHDTASREAIRMEADGTESRLSFFGATAVVKPAVTGSRAGNVALQRLLIALADLGLIKDQTT